MPARKCPGGAEGPIRDPGPVPSRQETRVVGSYWIWKPAVLEMLDTPEGAEGFSVTNAV